VYNATIIQNNHEAYITYETGFGNEISKNKLTHHWKVDDLYKVRI
jgi:hypothetical protein